MEIQSPKILKSIDSLNKNSIRSSSRSSVIRYTPSQIQEEKSVHLLDLFQDSLELPRPKSRLLDFQDKESVPDLPRHTRKHSSNLDLKKASITDLLNLLERPKPKSSLKTAAIKKHKTVSFSSQLELSSPDTVLDSATLTSPKEILEDSLELEPSRSTIATTVSSTIQDLCTKADKGQDITIPTQNELEESELTPAKDPEPRFYFEENVKGRLIREEEFNEYSTVAFCDKCKKETVTQVTFEKIKGSGCIDLTEWIICWMMPACMYRKKLLVHSCSFCNQEIMKSEIN